MKLLVMFDLVCVPDTGEIINCRELEQEHEKLKEMEQVQLELEMKVSHFLD